MVRVVLGVSSWVSLGRPATCPSSLQPSTSPAHDLALAHIEKSCLRWIRLIESTPDLVDCGRRGPAVARQLDALRDWLAASPDACNGYAPVWGGPAPMGSVTVKPLVPERMALPPRGASFELANWLPEPERSNFLSPRRIRRRDEPAAPRSRVHAPNWPKVLEKFDDSRILMLAREEDVPRDGYGRIPRNGAFGLEKDEDFDRVIIARVPSNSLELPGKLAGSLLPHGCQTCEKVLGPSEDWVFEVDDLRDFYPSCATSYEHALSTPIGPAMPASALEGTAALADARRLEAARATTAEPRSVDCLQSSGRGGGIADSQPAAAHDSSRKVDLDRVMHFVSQTHVPKASPARSARRADRWQPCIKSLSMGHLRAVDWAQLGHSNFLRAHGGLMDTEVLLYRASVPRAPCWDGVMIDDRVTMREAPRGSKLGESPQAAAAVAAYLRHGLEAKASKRVRDAVEAEFWGAHVHGAEGWTRVSDDGLRRPVGASLALCELGAVSADLWQSVRGLWPNPLLYRRCALGLLDEVYSFEPEAAATASAGRVNGPPPPPPRNVGHAAAPAVARIPARVRAELLSLVALSPLFWTNLRAPVSTELGATDASDSWCALVTAQIGPKTAKELWRVRDKRARAYVRCETELEAIVRRVWTQGEPDEKVIVAAAFADTDADLPDYSEHERKYAWVSDLADSLGWREETRYRVGIAEHINIKELRGYRTRLRHAARRPECHGTRRLTLLDSSVVRGLASKGRCSSRRLNRIWRPVIPELLAADIQDGTLPVPTKHMPADAATRNARTRTKPL